MKPGEENPQTVGVVHVLLVYDMKTGKLNLQSKAPTIVLMGVLATAQTAVMTQQVKAQIDKEAGREPAPEEGAQGPVKDSAKA